MLLDVSGKCAVLEVDIEETIISRLLNDLQDSKYGKNPEKSLNNLRGKLQLIIDKEFEFEFEFHKDIYEYILINKRSANETIHLLHVQNHLSQMPRYSKLGNTIKTKLINLIGASIESFQLIHVPFTELIDELIGIRKQRKIKKQLSKEINGESIDLENVKNLLDSIEFSGSKVSERLEKKVKKYQSSLTPVERSLVKLDLKQEGLTPYEVNQLIAESVPPREPPKVLTGREFLLKDYGDSNWLYPGIIPANVVTLIAGQAGSGKTAFANSLMLSYLNNVDFLREQPSILVRNPKKRGLIINADQPATDAQEMLKSSPLAYKACDKFDIVESGWTMADSVHLEMLIQSIGYTFVVIDSYKAIHSHLSNWDENASTASDSLKELQRIASAYGVTIIVIHHAGHSGRHGHQARGHSSISDTASCVMSIEATRMERNKGNHNHNLRFLDISKIRNAERSQLTIEFDRTKYEYIMHLDAAGQKRNNVSAMANKLIPDFDNCPGRIAVGYFMGKLARSEGERMIIHDAIKKLEMRGVIKKNMDENDLETVYYSRVFPKAIRELTIDDIGF